MDISSSSLILSNFLIYKSESQQTTAPKSPATVAVTDTENTPADSEKKWQVCPFLDTINRKRLDFEAMRDSVLSVSGSLSFKQGGRSIRIANKPDARCRTVYGFVNRQNWGTSRKDTENKFARILSSSLP